jgi:tetratricopeptide (TPR) repeat protein
MIRTGLRAPQELVLANQMMEAGDYAGAAEQFEVIARIDEARGGQYAPQLYLQAGRARLLSGHNEAGLAHLKHGLSLFANRADWLRLHRAGRRIIAELNQRGLTDEAHEISEFINSNLPGNFSAPRETRPARKPILPTHCPSCGAALRPDEVDWLDDLTAECAYCGSPVREES